MIIKIPLLIATAYLWIKTENALLAASVWGITILLLNLAILGIHFPVLIGALISFVACFGILSLLERTTGTVYFWATSFFGIVALLFFL